MNFNDILKDGRETELRFKFHNLFLTASVNNYTPFSLFALHRRMFVDTEGSLGHHIFEVLCRVYFEENVDQSALNYSFRRITDELSENALINQGNIKRVIWYLFPLDELTNADVFIIAKLSELNGDALTPTLKEFLNVAERNIKRLINSNIDRMKKVRAYGTKTAGHSLALKDEILMLFHSYYKK